MRNVYQYNKNSGLHLVLTKVLFVGLVLLLSSCAPDSGSPTIEELVKVDPPLFVNGQTSITLSTPSQSYTLSGKCDSSGFGLQYSTDNSTFQDVPGDCSNNAFSFSIFIVRELTVYMRSKSKTHFSPTSIAFIRYVLPPNSPLLGLVQGSASPDSASSDPVMQWTAPQSMTGIPTFNASFNLATEITGVAYDDP